MEDIDKSISILQQLIRCNDIEEVRKLVGPTEKTNLNYESMPSIDQLNEQTKAFVLRVEKLSGRGMFPEGIALDEEKKGFILSTSKLAGETTAIRNMEKIYDLIIDDVKKIGIYGMGGIGKTTIMKHINNRFLEEKNNKFDKVIWVTVSKESSVFKLQDDIGRKLNVDLSNDRDTMTRAGTLLEALKKRGRWLLILDDLWKDYSLEEVGIPDPNHANGCKLVLTTRSFEVCQSMKCETIKMDLLSKEEAWTLFLHHVGDYVLQIKDLVPIVKAVASECACLPLAIAIIATSMAGKKQVCDWRNALSKLRAFSKESGDKGRRVIDQLKFSYDRLENKKLQKCLLLCALYPEDEKIKRRELVELLALEGIIEEKESKMDEIDEGNAMLNDLINQCLLEGGKTYGDIPYVKMHDLVRDMALQIDSLHSKYLTVSGIELSNVKLSKKLLKIHISNCYSSNMSPMGPRLTKFFLRMHISNYYSSNVSPMCPSLTTFFLKGDSLANIPDSFFQYFNVLKILNLSHCRSLLVLPNSISDLVNLVGLLLRNCRKLTYVPPLARLKDLQTLDLSLEYINCDSGLLKRKDLIEGLKKLSKLRYVNLSLCSIKVFPLGVIPRLFNLRYLVCHPLTKVSVTELMGLKNLEMFKGYFHDIYDLCVYVKHKEQKISQFSSYFFGVGSTSKNGIGGLITWYNSGDKVVQLENCNLGKLATEDEYLLPKDVQELCITSEPDLASLCALASLNSATDLRDCKIEDCNGVRELVSTSSSSSFVLPSLESLRLIYLQNLEALIGRKKRACNVFPRLRSLYIKGCSRMKVVINIGLLSNLNNMEELSIQRCYELEEIIGEGLDDEKDVNEGITQITLPKLTYLTLENLPHLRYICPASRPLICKSLEKIRIEECPEVEECVVYVGGDERGKASPSASLQPIQLNSPLYIDCEMYVDS